MTENKKRGRRGVLSVVIDPFLFEGGRTIPQIADEVIAKLGLSPSRKPAIVNNIRSRMFFYTRPKRGCTIEKSADGIVKLLVGSVVKA